MDTMNNMNAMNTNVNVKDNAASLGLALDPAALAAFEAGGSSGYATLEPGVYDGEVRGYVIKNHVYEGENHGPKVQLVWQLADGKGGTRTLLGKRWRISSNEKSAFRVDLLRWFGTSDWPSAVSILRKGGVLVSDGEGARFDIGAFIGKRGRLMVDSGTSKGGKPFNKIMGLMPASKAAAAIGEDTVPAWMLEGALDYRLAPGIAIREAGGSEGGVDGDPGPEAPAPADIRGCGFSEDDLPF